MPLSVELTAQAKQLFSYLLNDELAIEDFQGINAYQLARSYVSALHEGTNDSTTTDVECSDVHFQVKLESLICDPRLKRVAKAMYDLMHDSCEDIRSLKSCVEAIVRFVDDVSQHWSQEVRHHASSHLSIVCPVAELAALWKEYNQELHFVHWMDALISMCVIINYATGAEHPFVVSSYASWLTLLLSHRVSDSCEDIVNESIAMHLSLPMTSLILGIPHFDEDNADVKFDTKPSVAPLRRIFKNIHAIRGLLCDENGTEFVRRLIDRLSLKSDAFEELDSILDSLFDSASQIGFELHRAKSQDRVFGIEKPLWFAPWNSGSPLLMTPPLLISHLTLKSILPLAGAQSRPGVNVPAHARNTRQAAAFSILKTLVRNIPELFGGLRYFESHLLLLEDEDTFESDGEVEAAAGSEEENSAEDATPAAKMRKPKISKKRLRQTGYETLLNTSLEPLLSFFAQLVLLSPERREARDRTLSLVINFLRNRENTANFNHFFVKLVVLLTKMTLADRASVRILALEMLTACIGSNDIIFQQIRVFSWLQRVYFVRSSDVSPPVRNRSLDLLAQLLTTITDRMGRVPALITWLNSSESSELDPVVPSPNDESKAVEKGPERNEQKGLDFGTILVILNLRILDEKSVVRKSCINLLLAIFGLLVKLEPQVEPFRLIDPNLLMNLCDDSGLLVRQRFVGFLSTLFGMFEASMEIRSLIMNCWLQLAMDSEESVASKAKESLKVAVIDSLANEIRIFWKQCGPVVDVTQFSILNLLSHLFNDGDAIERFVRVLLALAIQFPENVTLLLRAICQDTPQQLPELPVGVLRILDCCLEALKGKQILKASKASLSSCLALQLQSRGLGDSTPDSAVLVLSILCKTIPYDPSSSQESKEEFLLFVRDLLQGLKCHPRLVGPLMKLYFLLQPDQAAYREEICRLVQITRRHLATFRPALSGQTLMLSPAHAATVMQMAGICYVLGSRIPQSNRVAQYLKEIAEPMATAMLSLASNVFKKPSVHATPLNNGESFISRDGDTSVDGTSEWISDVPHWVRAIALSSASQILLNHESAAKRLILKLMEAGAMVSSSKEDRGILASNLAFAGFDLSLKMTSLIDPYFPLMSSFLAHQQLSSFARAQILALLFQLAAQDFLKPRGLVTYHFLSALSDPEPDVSNLAKQGVLSVLKPRVRDLFFMNLVEMVCFLTGFFTHPEVKCALDFHPICAEVCDPTVSCIGLFNLNHNEPRRMQTYAAMLAMANDHTKHLLTLKVLSSFLGPFIGSPKTRLDLSAAPIPVDRSSPAGLALSDILRILSSSDFKLSYTLSQSKSNREVTEDLAAATEDLDSEKIDREGKAKEDRHITKEFLKQAVMPVLVSLRKSLREANSALQKDVYECMACLMFDFRNELEDIVGDQHLVHLLRRSYHESTQSTLCEEETGKLEEYFFNASVRSKYSRKPLAATSGSNTYSRRSSVIIQSNSPNTIIPIRSVTPAVPDSTISVS